MSIVTISVSNRRTWAKIGFQEKSLYFVNNGEGRFSVGIIFGVYDAFLKKKRVFLCAKMTRATLLFIAAGTYCPSLYER